MPRRPSRPERGPSALPVSREDLASWLEGPRAAAERQGVVFPARGQRLGLPADGTGSVAGIGRRLVALLIDWVAASVVVLVIGLRPSADAYGWLVLAAFALVSSVALALTGRSIGHAAMRLHLEDLSTRGWQPARVVVRQVLICLVIPACIWDADGRGLHDKIAGTVLVRS